jgi:PKD repeat protein
MKNYLLLFLLLLFVSPAISYGSEMTTLQIDFAFDTSQLSNKYLSGFKLYKEGNQVCETYQADVSSINCDIPTEVGTFGFTLSAAYSDGTESPQSPQFSFTIDPPITSPPVSQGSKTITYSWDKNTVDTNLAGYRMYMNDTLLCQKNEPSATALSCDADLYNGAMAFSVATIYTDGSESLRSNILVLDPSKNPGLFIMKSLTFNWNYTDNSENAGGFHIYNNGDLLCKTTDPAARQLTCQTELSNQTNIFTIAAVDSNGLETGLSNALTYTIPGSDSGAPSDTNPLLAVINPMPASGEVPLHVSFSAADSTGDITEYSWDFGDGTTGAGSVADHTYSDPGTYTATLIVKDQLGTSQHASATITAQPSTAPSTPPAAVIASSATVGSAPLTVTFDGSSSTTANPPIVSYSWAFGDDSSATGETSIHTFTQTGTFYTELTVVDSKGLTGKVNTPIIVTDTAGTNEIPTAVISATLPQENGSLTVSFDGSQSSDPDGSIVQYNWNFGDGTTATGATTQHTYSETKAYTVSLLVTDNQGGTATSTKNIDFNNGTSQDSIKLEVGEVSIDHSWVKVLFDNTFTEPVVIAGPPTFNGIDPSTVRIRNIDQTGFEIRMQEWDYLDGSHAKETINYIVIDKGIYTLGNGSKIEAGSFTGSTTFKPVTLQQSYIESPVILTQVMTENEIDAVTGRIRNVGQSSFEFKMQEMETNPDAHIAETIGYLAWEPGKGEISGLLYEAETTSTSVKENWYTLPFQTEFAELPLFIAGMQTSAGADPAAVRRQNLSQTTVQVKIEEEQSLDAEIIHAAEAVGYLSISAANAKTSSRLTTFTWEFDSSQENNISGFNVYNNDQLVCGTTNPADRTATCETEISLDSNSFTIKAKTISGSETDASNSLKYKP